MERERQERPENGQQPGARDWMLTGAFQHSVDPKGRIIIPQVFREELGEGIVVGVNIEQKCIAVYPREVWHGYVEELKEKARHRKKLYPIAARFSRLSYAGCSFDQQGRLLIPQLLRDLYIKDALSVEVSGAFDHVLIVPDEEAKIMDKLIISGELDVLAELDAGDE